jgi:hypothetical protein
VNNNYRQFHSTPSIEATNSSSFLPSNMSAVNQFRDKYEIYEPPEPTAFSEQDVPFQDTAKYSKY